MHRKVVALAFLLATFSMAATTQEMCLKEGYPAQVNSLTCQSRYLALALGHLAPSVFPIDSVKSSPPLSAGCHGFPGASGP